LPETQPTQPASAATNPSCNAMFANEFSNTLNFTVRAVQLGLYTMSLYHLRTPTQTAMTMMLSHEHYNREKEDRTSDTISQQRKVAGIHTVWRPVLSWTTTANDAVETVPPEAVQESSIQFGVDEEQQQGEMLHQTCHCCCDAGVTIVHHCCCASSSHTTGALCAQHRVVQGQPITADVACIGPVPVDHACKCRKRGSCHHYICCRVLGAEHARAVEAAGRECICCVEEGEEVAKEKMAWWVRWGKWFCCF
jgi:hypothetical protein